MNYTGYGFSALDAKTMSALNQINKEIANEKKKETIDEDALLKLYEIQQSLLMDNGTFGVGLNRCGYYPY